MSLAQPKTDSQIDREACEAYIWDVFKSIHGIRPRFMDFSAMSLAELQATADQLEVDLKAHTAEEIKAEAEAAEQFEATLTRLIESGASDRATAIRWLRDAHDDEQVRFDDGYFEYLNGLPYGYLAK